MNIARAKHIKEFTKGKARFWEMTLNSWKGLKSTEFRDLVFSSYLTKVKAVAKQRRSASPPPFGFLHKDLLLKTRPCQISLNLMNQWLKEWDAHPHVNFASLVWNLFLSLHFYTVVPVQEGPFMLNCYSFQRSFSDKMWGVRMSVTQLDRPGLKADIKCRSLCSLRKPQSVYVHPWL